jgi:hypothetical protein
VLQLAKIYSCAKRTLVWLGDEDNIQDASFSTCWENIQRSGKFDLEDVTPLKGAELMSRHQGVSLYRVPAPVGGSPSLERAYQDSVSAIVALLSKYLTRPWFNRLWMYQEVLLAQECVCCIGPYELEWSYVQQAFSSSKRPNVSSNIDELGPFTPWMRKIFTSSPSASNVDAAPSLKQLLLETMPLECSDDRDKVYALLGLTRWSKRRETISLEVWPDYTKTVIECMRDATCAVIREDADLDCLILRTLTGPKPTWVIPWHLLKDYMSVLDYLNSKERFGSRFRRFDCSGGRPLDCENMRLLHAPDSLFLRGLHFRNIARISSNSNEKAHDMSIVTKLRILLERIDSVSDGNLAGVDTRVICYTICRNLSYFAPGEWTLPKFEHVFNLPISASVDEEQEEDLGDEQCPPKVEEPVVRSSDKEQHGEDQKQDQNSSEHLEKTVNVQDAYKSLVEARKVITPTVHRTVRTVNRPQPSNRFVLDEDIDTSSDDTAPWDKVASIVHRAIVTLQDKWHSDSSLDNDTGELPDLDYIEGARLQLNSSLDHCLTNSRFYIPAPDWSETKPVEFSIGIGPAEMEPGDQVAILFGCNHPVILRPEGSSWLYVGPAYAHEMMSGDFVSYWEVLREHGVTVVDSEVFELR